MTALLSIDPGMSVGWCLGSYTDTEPWMLDDFGQFEGGLGGFMAWSETMPRADNRVVERFVPLTGQGFSHTAKSVEPLRVEGAVVALGLMPADPTAEGWHRASQQYWVSGKNAPEKRRKQKLWVKENHPELYKTGKDVGCRDAEDYWSSLFHSLTYMRHLRHMPTLSYYWPEGDEK